MASNAAPPARYAVRMINLGETLTFSWRPGYTVTTDQRLLDALVKARAALIAVACTGQTITYKGLEQTIEDRRYQYRNFHGLLDTVSLDCQRRGEHSLAALVVKKGTTTPSWGFIPGDDLADSIAREQQALYNYWQGRTTA